MVKNINSIYRNLSKAGVEAYDAQAIYRNPDKEIGAASLYFSTRNTEKILQRTGCATVYEAIQKQLNRQSYQLFAGSSFETVWREQKKIRVFLLHQPTIQHMACFLERIARELSRTTGYLLEEPDSTERHQQYQQSCQEVWLLAKKRTFIEVRRALELFNEAAAQYRRHLDTNFLHSVLLHINQSEREWPPIRATGDFVFDTATGTVTNYVGKAKDMVIPAEINGVAVTAIEKKAFCNKGLTGAVIPDGVRRIGSLAFERNCLTHVVIPKGVTHIDFGVFQFNELTSVDIPYGVTVIGTAAFAWNSLTSVNIPHSVTTIDNYAFQCNKLTRVVIPTSVITIDSRAFAWNDLTEVVLPRVTVFEGDTFDSVVSVARQ